MRVESLNFSILRKRNFGAGRQKSGCCSRTCFSRGRCAQLKMKTFQLEIRRPKKLTKRLTILGWIILFVGIILSFVLKQETSARLLIIGGSLVVGLLILLSLKVLYPLEKTGLIELSHSEIKITDNHNTMTLDINQIIKIEVAIGGGHMTVNKGWWPLSREFFPFEHGHDNELHFKKSDGKTISTAIYLADDKQEKQFKNLLTDFVDKQKIELKIRNN